MASLSSSPTPPELLVELLVVPLLVLELPPELVLELPPEPLLDPPPEPLLDPLPAPPSERGPVSGELPAPEHATTTKANATGKAARMRPS
ncbi:MAG: hypothetical protein ABSE49_04215 [Polyangiaceae bacterium]